MYGVHMTRLSAVHTACASVVSPDASGQRALPGGVSGEVSRTGAARAPRHDGGVCAVSASRLRPCNQLLHSFMNVSMERYS